MWKQNLFWFSTEQKCDGRMQVSSSRPGDLKGAHLCLLFWGPSAVFPPRVPFVSGPPGLGRGPARASRAPSRLRWWTEVVYYFPPEWHANHEDPPSPPAQSARWEVHRARGPAVTGRHGRQSSAHPARMAGVLRQRSAERRRSNFPHRDVRPLQ